MKKFLVTTSILVFAFSFSQNKTQLTDTEIQFIAENRAGGVFSEPDELKTKQIMDLDKTIFFIEIYKEGKVLFAESFQRWNPFVGLYNQSRRTSVPLCFKFSDVAPDVMLKLLETPDWQSKKAGTTKYICNNDYQVFKLNKQNKTYSINQIEGFEVKAFKSSY